MKRLLTILPVVAAASTASAQWEFALSNPVLSPSAPSTTVTLSLAPPPGDWGVAAAIWDVHATEPGWSDQVMLIQHPGQAPGTIAGGSVLGITAGQLICTFGCTPQRGRIDMWQATFTVTDFTPREINLSTDTAHFQVYIEDPLWQIRRGDRIAVEGLATIRIVPAPGAAAALGFGALFWKPGLGRRRAPHGPRRWRATRPAATRRV